VALWLATEISGQQYVEEKKYKVSAIQKHKNIPRTCENKTHQKRRLLTGNLHCTPIGYNTVQQLTPFSIMKKRTLQFFVARSNAPRIMLNDAQL
jgi:hypothetical protein